MKEKISITLDSRIVKKIETIAKQQNINRSKFIESILMEKLDKTPILILGGWAELNKTPKPLVKYQNKRLIVRQIEMLSSQGFDDIYISISSTETKTFIEKNFPQVKVIFETKKKGSGGTLKSFAKMIRSRFVFMHCDILFDLDLHKLIDFHIKEASGITLVLKTMKNPSKYGTARMEGNRIVDFEEKPKNTSIYLIYTGIGVAEPKAFDNLDDHGKFELQLNKIRNKRGYIYEGFWKDFETAEDL